MGVVWISIFLLSILSREGWSDGAMVLGKLPVPGRPKILITVGQGPFTLAEGAGEGSLDIFTLIYPVFPRSPSLWETARYRLKYCLKGPLNPKQPINQIFLPTVSVYNGPSAKESSSAGASYSLNNSRTRAYCTYRRCRWGLFGHLVG